MSTDSSASSPADVENFSNDATMDEATETALNSLAIEDAVMDGTMEEKPSESVGIIQSPEHQEELRNRRRRRSMLWGGIVTFLVLVGIIGLSVGIANKNSKSTSRSTSPNTDASENNNGGNADFSFSKEDIDNVCSSLSVVRNARQCEEACEVVDCCDPFAEDTCITSNLRECVNYAKCHTTRDITSSSPTNDGIGPSPVELAVACSEEGLSSSPTFCQDVCNDVKCCWDDSSTVESCKADKFLMCLDYAPCQNLNNRLPMVAPPNLDEICDPSSTRYSANDCQDICTEASCCDITQSDDNCLEENFMSCLSYAPCGFTIIQERAVGADVEPPSGNFRQTCSFDNMVEGINREECTELCRESQCCHDLDQTKNCFADDPFTCLQYSSCILLEWTGGTVERAPDSLWKDCNLQNIIMEEDDAGAACDAACTFAKSKGWDCCWDLDPERNCAIDGNLVACGSYAPCALWDATNNIIGMPPDEVKTECTWEKIRNGDVDGCEAACVGSECCWTMNEEENCLIEGNLLQCAAYAPCKLMDLNPDGTVDPVPDNFKDVCTWENIMKGGDDRAACETACAGSECCRTVGGDSCLNLENFMVCAEYAICNVLDIVPDNGGGGGDDGDGDQGGDDTDTAPAEVPEAPSNLGDVCKSFNDMRDDSQAIEECAAICEPSACCRGFGAESCISMGSNMIENMRACAKWSDCMVLDLLNWIDDGSGGSDGDGNTSPPPIEDNFPTEPIDAIRDVCGADVEDLSQCQAFCEPAKCCATLDASNCALKKPEACAKWSTAGCWRAWI
mmetsp:Transcript_667/g.944  ORF Transcript_667/g.944 Transcript_667/m.944 type:complete len:792 (-) Transcript_667:167-2542(-)